MKSLSLFIVLSFLLFSTLNSAEAQPIVYEGEKGLGHGKHIVFTAGDHEYRSEETLPALARILAKHHGFKCTVIFSVDKTSGEITPDANWMPGMETLKDADLWVNMLRFRNLPHDQMQAVIDYLGRGGSIVGLRTSTHAFSIPNTSEFARYSYDYKGKDYEGGFGRQILGETWAGHYGTNHVMSTRLELLDSKKSLPILSGVDHVWVQAGGYWTVPTADCDVLALAQPLQGMTPDSPPAAGKEPCPGVWTRVYENKDGDFGRVFTSTYGASEDILNPGYRRLLVNACIWAVGLEDQITPDLNIEFVGAYNPVTFSFGGHRKGVKPADLAGWDTPIMSTDKSFAPPPKKDKK
jgi:type 1 glutamine amidotransferase